MPAPTADPFDDLSPEIKNYLKEKYDADNLGHDQDHLAFLDSFTPERMEALAKHMAASEHKIFGVKWPETMGRAYDRLLVLCDDRNPSARGREAVYEKANTLFGEIIDRFEQEREHRETQTESATEDDFLNDVLEELRAMHQEKTAGAEYGDRMKAQYPAEKLHAHQDAVERAGKSEREQQQLVIDAVRRHPELSHLSNEDIRHDPENALSCVVELTKAKKAKESPPL